MLIYDIEVEGFINGALSGNIALISRDQRINVPLTLPDGTTGENTASTLRQRIVDEAVRLARRMPEFRTGQTTLSFAPGLMGLSG